MTKLKAREVFSGTHLKMLCLVGVVIWFWGLLESLPHLLNELQAREREKKKQTKTPAVDLCPSSAFKSISAPNCSIVYWDFAVKFSPSLCPLALGKDTKLVLEDHLATVGLEISLPLTVRS